MRFPLAFISAPGPVEMLIIGIIAVLLFGKRLPEVGRALGRGIIEFKKGLKGIEDELQASMSTSPATERKSARTDLDDRQEPTAPKFVPPAASPAPEQPQEEKAV